MADETRSVTTHDLLAMKERGERIVVLTCYDALFARLLDAAGVDLLLVGDSVNQVLAGAETTLSATLEQMIYHTKIVRRGAVRAMVVCDMPFLTYQVSAHEAIRNCGRVMQETDCHGVKLEGGAAMAETVRALVDVGIPVMGHLGLTPQSVHALGGYRVQGRDEKTAERLKTDAKALEQAGAFAIVLELIPAPLASQITKSLTIPTIGIGAGPACDGQVLVLPDMLGLNDRFNAKFVKRYAALAVLAAAAWTSFVPRRSSRVTGAVPHSGSPGFRVRTITAGTNLKSLADTRAVEAALATLKRAKQAVTDAGYEVQTVRIATQPLLEDAGPRARGAAMSALQALDRAVVAESALLSIGPVLAPDGDDPEFGAWAAELA